MDTGGASTLLSRAKSTVYVNQRRNGIKITDPVTGKKKYQYIDPVTGKKLYSDTGATKKELIAEKVYEKDANGNFVRDENGKKVYTLKPILNEKGKKQYRDTGKLVQEKSTQMMETDDARKLSAGYLVEEHYADYANKIKGLANEARKAYLATPSLKKDPKAKEKYKKEIESLDAKLLIALKNAPRERQAQILANLQLKEKLDANPYMDSKEEKKVKAQLLNGARAAVGAKKLQLGSKKLPITEREWEAVNSGAISNNKCELIVENADLDFLKKLSMPRANNNSLSAARIAKVHAMNNSGFSIEEIANSLGVSATTVSKYLNA